MKENNSFSAKEQKQSWHYLYLYLYLYQLELVDSVQASDVTALTPRRYCKQHIYWELDSLYICICVYACQFHINIMFPSVSTPAYSEGSAWQGPRLCCNWGTSERILCIAFYCHHIQLVSHGWYLFILFVTVLLNL